MTHPKTFRIVILLLSDSCLRRTHANVGIMTTPRIVLPTSVVCVCVSHILLVDAGETQQRTVLPSYLQEDQTPQLWISLCYVDGSFSSAYFRDLGTMPLFLS